MKPQREIVLAAVRFNAAGAIIVPYATTELLKRKNKRDAIIGAMTPTTGGALIGALTSGLKGGLIGGGLGLGSALLARKILNVEGEVGDGK